MQTYLDRLPQYRIALIGDLMLDRYMEGAVRRISPEAPVPVVNVRSQRAVAGGAANVAINLAALGLGVHVVGLIGRDEAGQHLLTALDAFPTIDRDGVVIADDRQTIQKLRIIGTHQQIVRIDQEDVIPLPDLLEATCIAAAKRAIDSCDVVILSDYGKGLCSDALLQAVIEHARAAAKPVLVDPKRRDFAAYRGATILTPNRNELSAATQMSCETDEEVVAAVAKVQLACDSAILLTRSEKGLSFFPREGRAIHLATVAQDVFDVSGAGDTVIAVLAASISAGVPIEDGLRMANHAAGIVVSKLGTASVSRDELAASLAAGHSSPSVNDGRYLDWDTLAAQRWAWARERLVVGFTNGCFDLLHPGHVGLIEEATRHCDRLIVALNSDSSVRRLKGEKRPVQDEQARIKVMSALRGVSAVTIFCQDTPLELIEKIQPDVIVKGADYREDEVVGAEIVRKRGGRIILANLENNHSTTRLIAAATGSP
ncbi:MAG: D-glycero-beta-D-manno-heptose-7-phosphate kinase [Candidatus Sphingomonas phytovorans]|nr:D-glycero-beta-D-manno-heptose-7-phosphate kinase [Sphingomonas sp.]WEJ99515.1 MAG: D-glycero-beta-D-manno-heptose-7-phosphate kinase [Sphingomonas sp.]